MPRDKWRSLMRRSFAIVRLLLVAMLPANAALALPAGDMRAPARLTGLSPSAVWPAEDARRFDGNWAVTLVCLPDPHNAFLGFTWQFAARIKDGVLHGQRGIAGLPASLTLDGPIQPDGSALLTAHGLTGDPFYTVGHVGQGTPFGYHVKAQFSGDHGSGNRIELRACNYSFVRE
jgi:hypothetical protein